MSSAGRSRRLVAILKDPSQFRYIGKGNRLHIFDHACFKYALCGCGGEGRIVRWQPARNEICKVCLRMSGGTKRANN